MMVPRSTTVGSIATLLFLAATVLPQAAQAQQPDLVLVYGMAYARAGPYLYFNGGGYMTTAGKADFSQQLVALPLNATWSVNSPPWKKLAPGNAGFNYRGVATADNKTFITFFPQSQASTVGKYNIQQNTWKYTLNPTPEIIDQGSRPVVDPLTGLIYMVGATKMNIYNPGTDVWQSQTIPNNTLNMRIYGDAVYAHSRKSIMYFGGYALNSTYFEPETYITEYTIATGTWSIFVSSAMN